MMVAPAAELLFWKVTVWLLVIVALLAVLPSKKLAEPALMLSEPALLVFLKFRVPVLVMLVLSAFRLP